MQDNELSGHREVGAEVVEAAAEIEGGQLGRDAGEEGGRPVDPARVRPDLTCFHVTAD